MQYEAFYSTYVENLRAGSGSAQAYGKCPLHEDKVSSFSVNLITGLWSCHASCGCGNALTFSRRLGAPAPSSTDFSPVGVAPPPRMVTSPAKKPCATNLPNRKVVRSYIYEDRHGSPLFRVLRYDPKGFSQQHWKDGEWLPGRANVERVPFHLPKILQTSRTIFLVEGEKDVERLESISLLATTVPMGANSWDSGMAMHFKGKRVVIIPDNDGPGKTFAKQAAGDLVTAGATVKIVELPGIPDKGDVSDFLDVKENTRDVLLDLVRRAPEIKKFQHVKMDPVKYFALHDITVVPGHSLLPTEFKSFCRDSFKNVTAGCGKVTDAVMEKLDKLDVAWKSCRTERDYNCFLRILKEVHELAV